MSTELNKSFEPAAIEAKWAPRWEASGAAAPTLEAGKPSFSIQLPPPERHRHAAHGPRLQPHDHGCADPHAPHERFQHALAAGHGPRRHRHADRCRAPVAGARAIAPRHRPRRIHQTRVGVEGDVGQRHHRPDAAHRRHGGLEPRVLHDGRHAVGGRQRNLRAAVRRRFDLPRQAAGELGPGVDVGGVGPRGGKRRGRWFPLAHPLPARRWLGLARRGDDAAGDDAR